MYVVHLHVYNSHNYMYMVLQCIIVMVGLAVCILL